ncbi:lycopene cyclase domain-containing protein [Janibacter alkaliphilus]|uniref:Lycopene cyclase domain-containing protein n=1 Tax=Janibacter alkaliphilus TaxID=1069963 RepID=A0A852X5U2_9MICO|nr:lycopene cyclase domain-containing protein [Janibacter alkaliphilus]NYG37798.1 lycopene cyclase domain-containing protein [Janibacter alkaliphilus]
MSYTMLAVLAVVVVLALDRWIVRTRLTSTLAWWLSYTIIITFQLLTNGWLTGREIVQYDPDVIIGGARPRVFGDGRLVYAPVEDLLFGFALVLGTCVAWTWLGRRDPSREGAAR